MTIKRDRNGKRLADQPTAKPTKKVTAQATGTGGSALVLGLADELGIDLSWLLDRPILFTVVCAAVGLAAGWAKRELA